MARVAALVHFAKPWRNAGSETVLHSILAKMAAEGHEVRCYVTACPEADRAMLDGVEIISVRSAMHAVSKLQPWQPHVTFTHHDNAVTVLQMRRRIRSRVIFLTHNEMDVTKAPLKLQPDFVVWNTEWVKESLQRKVPEARTLRGMVMHPPFQYDAHKISRDSRPREAITLVNHNEHKGAHVIYALAEMMPERGFIVVDGGHGVQVPVPRHLRNVERVPQNPDMRPVWARSRIVLMPSLYESFGLVSVEAGVSGIPVIAHPTPGLREALGSAGIFADRDDVQTYADVIEMLDDEEIYARFSAKAMLNSALKAERTSAALAQLARQVEKFALPGHRVV